MTQHVSTSALGCVRHTWNAAISVSTSEPVVRGLILDLDDTLYPREHYVQSGLMAAARYLESAHGVSAIDAFIVMSAARREGRHRSEFQAACARFSLPSSLVATLIDVFRAHRPVLRLPNATDSVVAELNARGWRLAILTNGLPSVQRLKVEALGLHRRVEHVIYADEHAPGGKPNSVVFHEALRRLGLPVSRTIMVGDDVRCDIAGARALGMRTIRLATDSRVAMLPEADAVVDTLEPLPAVAAALLEAVTVHAA